jgi:hypothetical protein
MTPWWQKAALAALAEQLRTWRRRACVHGWQLCARSLVRCAHRRWRQQLNAMTQWVANRSSQPGARGRWLVQHHPVGHPGH